MGKPFRALPNDVVLSLVFFLRWISRGKRERVRVEIFEVSSFRTLRFVVS